MHDPGITEVQHQLCRISIRLLNLVQYFSPTMYMYNHFQIVKTFQFSHDGIH